VRLPPSRGTGITGIVTDLADLPDPSTASNDSLAREPRQPRHSNGRAASAGKEPQFRGITRLPFDLGFTAEQEAAWRSIYFGSDRFVVRNLTLQIPRVDRPFPDSLGVHRLYRPWDARRLPGAAPGIPGAANDLNVILGRELVSASMRIEIIGFPKAEQPGK
jgi:hypothetical protein